VPGYNLERCDRNREGGGVCLYIKNTIAYNRRDDLLSKELEFLAVDLLLPKTKPILLGAGYRPPTDYGYFSKLEEVLINSPSFIQQETFLLGDFNTDIKAKKNNLKASLDNFLRIFDLSQIIEDPTRITETSETIIDLIITSDKDKVVQSGVLPCKLSDHNVIFCTRKVSRGFFNKHNVTQIRSMKNYDVNVFKEKLGEIDWFQVINDENVNSAWKKFCKLFLGVVDVVAPIKSVRLKQNCEPWFSGEILHLISQRDKAWVNFRKCKNDSSFSDYKRLRNLTQFAIKKAKRDYIKNEIAENQNAPKALWKTLKNIGMPSKTKGGSTNIGLKDERDEVCFETEFVANKFNKFFCGVASKLVAKLRKKDFNEKKVSAFYQEKGVKPKDFRFSIITETDIEKLLKSLNVTKSTGCDNISAKFLKDGASIITDPVTYIINLSLSTSTVPVDFKTARVVPLYKKGDRNSEGNYRPVSILPVISKKFERVVYNQLCDYLDVKGLIYDFQSGFRRSYSTDSALTYLTDTIRLNMDAGLYTGIVLIDLQKAFDTVDHHILLSKLKALGADRQAVSWFESYLAERQQFVNVNGTDSAHGEVTCGVPQGSILGPLLFTIYVNDMARAVHCDLLLYADDSALVVSGKEPAQIEEQLSQNLESLNTWLEENKLSLHLGKTESVLFASKKKLSVINEMSISCNDVKIEGKKSVKYLGMVIDQDMSGSSMGTSVVQKVNSKIKFLYRNKVFFGIKERKMLCSALLQSNFDYACKSWYRGLQKRIKVRLQNAQNKIIRYILDYPNRQHIGFQDFSRIGWLNVSRRVDYLTLNSMYNIFNNTAPSYMCHLDFVNHGYHTRRSNLSYNVPNIKTQGSYTFKFCGIKLWNRLPLSIKTCETKEDFKKRCKGFLFNEMRLEDSSEFIM
jgi:hypothetical protein